MEAEYGVGVKNRFAYLNGDEDEEYGSVDGVQEPVRTPVSAGAKPKVVNKENKSSVNRSAMSKEKPLAKQDERKIVSRNGEMDGRRRDPRQGHQAAERSGRLDRDSRQGQDYGERSLRQNNRQQGREDGERGGRREYRPGQATGDRGGRRDFRNGLESGERGGRHGQDLGERGVGRETGQMRSYGSYKSQVGHRGGGDRRNATEEAHDNEPDTSTGETGPEKPMHENVEKDGGVEGSEGQEDERENKDEPTEKTLTLAEWKALQQPREKPVFNIRKPGEGDLSSKMGKLVLKKREDDLAEHEQEEEYEADEVYYPQRAGKQKLIADVGFNTGYQNQRRRGGRGGTPRGDSQPRERQPRSTDEAGAERHTRPRDRPRSGPRGVRQRIPQAPRIDDAADFPTLG